MKRSSGSIVSTVETHRSVGVDSHSGQPQWYAIYTRARHEKVVARLLCQRGVETFLPLREAKRPLSPWRSRITRQPLFPGYVFSRCVLTAEAYNRIRSTAGVVHIVGTGQGPSPVPNVEIESIRMLVDQKLDCQPFPYLQVGKRVMVTDGPLRGLVGHIVRRKSREYFVVGIDLLGRAVAVELKGSQLEPWLGGGE
ncbi:MAG: UpxY family transcription antiterminator [Acidobacteria bacterium]|nr:MAG: UpxY family transcription antiterminator [Acidobacteriota bacterium]